MAVKWNFEWFTTDGSPFISLDDWVKTLSVEEQKEFYNANLRQKSYRQEKINEGNLIVNKDNSYIWKDEQTEIINKPNDEIWLNYWGRWQVETSSSCRIIKEEI